MINAIADLNKYNTDMEKSMKDKIFFLDHIRTDDIDAIVDFGCANGALLDAMPKEWIKYGVDNNPDMKKICEEKSYTVYNSLDEVKNPQTRTLLNMSSVLHEVYAYLTQEEIAHFWSKVFDGSYEYITIRDMMVSDNTNRPADFNLLTNGADKYIKSFVSRWVKGTATQHDLLHYLLKYKYTDNWTRECNEDYLALSLEQLKVLIPERYTIIYEERYVLPYLKSQVFNDFGYTISDTTHAKLILKRRAKEE